MTSTATLTQESTMTAQTFTNTDRDAAQDMADRVNDAVANGWTVEVNGRKVKSWTAEAAKVWGNGSVSVDVRTREGRVNACGVWAKVGQSMTVEFTR
jgi:hypothetical protein